MEILHILRPDVSLHIIDYNLSYGHLVASRVEVYIICVIENIILQIIVNRLTPIQVK
jgi:hypothetical protein